MCGGSCGPHDSSWLRRVLIGLPFLWLAVFFLMPLLIVAGISLTTSADAIPPSSRRSFLAGRGAARSRAI